MKAGANPVMNQATRDVDPFPRVLRNQTLDPEFAPSEVSQSCFPFRLPKTVNPQEWIGSHLRFGHPHVAVERRHGARLQVGGICGSRDETQDDND